MPEKYDAAGALYVDLLLLHCFFVVHRCSSATKSGEKDLNLGLQQILGWHCKACSDLFREAPPAKELISNYWVCFESYIICRRQIRFLVIGGGTNRGNPHKAAYRRLGDGKKLRKALHQMFSQHEAPCAGSG